MHIPAVWPFSTPIVPGSVNLSGSAYVPDNSGTIWVHSTDVVGLLGYGFCILESSAEDVDSIVVDLDELSDEILAVFSGACGAR